MHRWKLLVGAAVLAAVMLFLATGQGPTSGLPGGRTLMPPRSGPVDNAVAVLQGVKAEYLPPVDISADFLWGAGKFAVLTITAPFDSALRLEEISIRRIGGSNELMPTVWVRMNRQRLYAQAAFSAPSGRDAGNSGALTIRNFPPRLIEPGMVVHDTVLDDIAHRLVLDPPTFYTIEAGESVVVEFFGNIEKSEVTQPTPVYFCLDSVSGTLSATGKRAESSLNETCWSPTTILPTL